MDGNLLPRICLPVKESSVCTQMCCGGSTSTIKAISSIIFSSGFSFTLIMLLIMIMHGRARRQRGRRRSTTVRWDPLNAVVGDMSLRLQSCILLCCVQCSYLFLKPSSSLTALCHYHQKWARKRGKEEKGEGGYYWCLWWMWWLWLQRCILVCCSYLILV